MSTQLFLLFLPLIVCAQAEPKGNVIHLPVDGREVTVNVTHSTKLAIFCYPGRRKHWLQLWANPRLTVGGMNKTTVSDDLTIYYGKDEFEIENSAANSFVFNFNALLHLKQHHSFTPFNSSCIGLSSHEPYQVNFTIKNPELWYIAYIAVGITIFFFAPSWSRNVAFHYGTGVSVGVLASSLICVFILTKLMPQRMKTLSYVVMAVSSSAALFMFQLVKTYMWDIIQNHLEIFFGYIAVSSIVSFALVYRFGPITDSRTLDLVRWVLQALGLFLIYQGTQIPEASAAVMILVMTIYVCPRSMPSWLKRLQFRFMTPKHRFLTEEEYLRQAEVETKKALADLREYCRSPKCDAWKTISRLDSPSRFAKFMEGDSHVSDHEMQEHDSFVPEEDFTDISESGDSDSETNLPTQPSDIRVYATNPDIRVYAGNPRTNGIGSARS